VRMESRIAQTLEEDWRRRHKAASRQRSSNGQGTGGRAGGTERSCLQSGQVHLTTNHGSMHPTWYRCMHGRTLRISPSENASKQMAHSLGPSSPSLPPPPLPALPEEVAEEGAHEAHGRRNVVVTERAFRRATCPKQPTCRPNTKGPEATGSGPKGAANKARGKPIGPWPASPCGLHSKNRRAVTGRSCGDLAPASWDDLLGRDHALWEGVNVKPSMSGPSGALLKTKVSTRP